MVIKLRSFFVMFIVQHYYNFLFITFAFSFCMIRVSFLFLKESDPLILELL